MLLAADVTLPMEILTACAVAITAAVAWLSKAMLDAIKRAEESREKTHNEVVSLTRETTSALSENTSAIHEISGAMDELAQSIRNRTPQ